ncbi:MAG: hypothetical protein P1P76_04470 [Anaerolineales bacterium]|nr:hypothetical protein [Anaerolineales bacterium]
MDTTSPGSANTRAYSLAEGSMGMFGASGGYLYGFDVSSPTPREEVVNAVRIFLDRWDNPDLQIGRTREFKFAYRVDVIERSTGRFAFGLMFGKATWQVSPEAGPNILWNTKYGTSIAEVGGGYGMIGRMLTTRDTDAPMPITEKSAREIAIRAVDEFGEDLALGEAVDMYYGFYEFYLTDSNAEPVGELDVNGYSGQVWFKDWGAPQRTAQELLPGE